jgi:neutral ceramidase
MLQCGAAKANIDPELPTHLYGYRDTLVAHKIHDSLHVAAMYLESNGERLALLTFDAICFRASLIEKIQQACAQATGLPPRAILTTVSHCHSTPYAVGENPWPTATENDPRTPPAKKYAERVIAQSVKALKDAIAAAEPATLSYNTSHIRENLNRRAFFPSGQYFYQPKQKNLLPLCDGIADDELGVLFFKSVREERFIATLVNYTAHPLTVGDTSTEVSADFPGVLKREIESHLGGVALFVNGACGDNHPLGAESGFGRCERMGQALAEKAMYHRWDSVALERTPLASDYREIILPAMTREQFEALPQNFESIYPGPTALAHENGGIRTWFSLWAIGPLLFIGVPGEVTAELGMRLKWDSPFPKTFVMFMSTDWVGYIPHRNAYTWGGYEVLVSRLAPTAGTVLCNQIIAAAEELKLRVQKDGPPLHLPAAEEGAKPGNGPGAARKKL